MILKAHPIKIIRRVTDGVLLLINGQVYIYKLFKEPSEDFWL